MITENASEEFLYSLSNYCALQVGTQTAYALFCFLYIHHGFLKGGICLSACRYVGKLILIKFLSHKKNVICCSLIIYCNAFECLDGVLPLFLPIL